jgi:signal transduction histidine kinase
MLDTPPEEDFDRLTHLAARLLHVPVSLVSLVDERRQFFKSIHGALPEPWGSARETPLSHSFCKHVVIDAAPLIVSDARMNAKVRDNLAIRDLGVVAYLGMPLQTSSGQPLGSFCVIDSQAREWSADDADLMRELANVVVGRIELRMMARLMQRKYLESRTLELQRDELVHMLVHDLRNPMSAFIGGLEIVAAEKNLSDVHRRFVQMALEGGEKLLGMVGNILDVSKAEAGRLTLDLSPCDPERLVRAVCDLQSPQAARLGVTMDIRVAPDVRPLRADVEKLHRVLVNLVGNAVQHTPGNGHVAVEVAAGPEGSVEFSVSDTGYGVPEEAFSRIFEKYGSVGTKKYHGASTGLGLPFARIAVEAHGGQIRVASEPGRGTRFSFTIPTGL